MPLPNPDDVSSTNKRPTVSEELSKRNFAARRYRTRVRLLILLALLLVTPFFAVTVGSASLPVSQVFKILASHVPGLPVEITWSAATDAIVWQTRLPRILVGIAVGAILGVSGVIFQALVRNPLAEPYVLGISSGASVGAASALIIFGIPSALGMGAFAFAGALIATLAVVLIAGEAPRSLHLVLSGLAVGFGFQAVTNLIIFSSGSPEASQAVNFWMLGSLARAKWSSVGLVAVIAVVLTVSAALLGPYLDALASGDATAQAVGVNPGRARLIFLLFTAVAVAAAVAAAGSIGFVGLIIPHVVRTFIGHSHRYLVIGTALTAALFLVWADAVARVCFSPVELPIGVITGLIGCPFLVVLVRKQRKIGI